MDQSIEAIAGHSCLVTGGAGAIGSNIVRCLYGMHCSVTVLDNLSSGFRDNLADLKGIRFIHGDVRNPAHISDALTEGPEYVFHLAAQFANQNSVEHPITDLETNASGTVQLLEACRKLSRLKAFVYASSSCVLGGQEGILSETSPLRPETPYAASKLVGEFYMMLYHRLHSLPTVVIRYFNVYGPGERPGVYRNVIPNFVDRALTNKPLRITGSGEETREFVFVEDAVRGTILAAVVPAAHGDLFHIGSGNVIKIRDLASRIRDLTRSNVDIEFQPRRSWDGVSMRQTSFEKARKILGYSPATSFDEGLRRTVDWIREQSVGHFTASAD